MKSNIAKILFLILASVSNSLRAELPDSLNSPSRNPCSHSDSNCLDYYANPQRYPLRIDEKRISVEIVDGLTADEIGNIPALALCKDYIFKEKIWELDKEKNDNGLISVELVFPEKYKGLTFKDSSLTYGKPLSPLLFVDLEPYVDDGELYYSLKFSNGNVPILFEISYSGMLDETSQQCYSGSIKIKL